MKQPILISAVLLASFFFGANGHGTLVQPPQRSSIWRNPDFGHLNPPPNYDDGGLWCNGVKQDYEAKECGVCGDDGSLSQPRPNENGGTFGQGIIVGNYSRGQEIPITFQTTAVHHGYFSVQICDDVADESHDCFLKRGYLPLAGGTTTQIDVGEVMGDISTTVRLPADLSCRRCVLRLYYRACKDWGECDGVCECTPPGAMCCGAQEVVLNCADISIAL